MLMTQRESKSYQVQISSLTLLLNMSSCTALGKRCFQQSLNPLRDQQCSSIAENVGHAQQAAADLGVHHFQVVIRQVGDDNFEGVQHSQGARRGEVQVSPHMVVQYVQR